MTPATATRPGLEPLDDFLPVDLASLASAIGLQTRVDRKYIVPVNGLEPVLDALRHRTHVLEIDGRRSFGYESVYFDTPDLVSYRAATHRRRRRFKIRTRAYLDSGECMLEVKTAGGRGETVKTRRDHDLRRRYEIDGEADDFVRACLGPAAAGLALAQTLVTSYRRSTLVDRHDAFRMTCDVDLVCAAPGGGSTALLDHVLVETKSAGPATTPDRLLWAAGHRPVRISKYCVGLAALQPQLPANRWHRTLVRYFGTRRP